MLINQYFPAYSVATLKNALQFTQVKNDHSGVRRVGIRDDESKWKR